MLELSSEGELPLALAGNTLNDRVSGLTPVPQAGHALLPIHAVRCSRRIRRRLPCDRSRESSSSVTLADEGIPQAGVLVSAAQGGGMERKWK